MNLPGLRNIRWHTHFGFSNRGGPVYPGYGCQPFHLGGVLRNGQEVVIAFADVATQSSIRRLHDVGIGFLLLFYSAVDSPTGLPRTESVTPVPRWCLAWEGPFLSELPRSDVGAFGQGYAFRNTTHKSSAFAQPSGKYGLLLHHPRFLEWIGAPESARLLDKDPNAWMHSLSREQAIEAARQLHWDVCLMTSYPNILDQYVLCLQSTAATILELSFGLFRRPLWRHRFCGFIGLQFLCRPWASGALRLIQLVGREMDRFAALTAIILLYGRDLYYCSKLYHETGRSMFGAGHVSPDYG